MNITLGPMQERILKLFLELPEKWFYTWEISTKIEAYYPEYIRNRLKRLFDLGLLAKRRGPGIDRRGRPHPNVTQWRLKG